MKYVDNGRIREKTIHFITKTTEYELLKMMSYEQLIDSLISDA